MRLFTRNLDISFVRGCNRGRIEVMEFSSAVGNCNHQNQTDNCHAQFMRTSHDTPQIWTTKTFETSSYMFTALPIFHIYTAHSLSDTMISATFVTKKRILDTVKARTM